MAISKTSSRIIKEKSTILYGKRKSKLFIDELKKLLLKYKRDFTVSKEEKFLDEKDIALITYGDSITSSKKKPLMCLLDFINQYIHDTVNIIHLLPFYPYSSDDGFSVINYKKVNPLLGTWKDIDRIRQKCSLMIDFIANHVSVQNLMFQKYLKGNKEYDNFFIAFDKIPDISSVVRAREHPLFTKFFKKNKTIYLWTTFSRDQVDLNYANEKVLLEMIDILLFYGSKNPKMIRLDAIGHIWKCLKTSCINLKAVHDIIQLMRAVLNEVYPQILLVTETNVPYKKNLKYFGNGNNEAQLIYNFAIPFLVLHIFYTGNASSLLKYISSIEDISKKTSLFNILATHDGIGVVPVKGILTEKEIKNVLKHVIQKGGFVSYKINRKGTKEPYELNITYYSAIADLKVNDEENIQKFIASQAIILSLKGIPGIYIHSLFGTENDKDGAAETGKKRAINRKKFSFQRIKELLSDERSREFKIFKKLIHLINIRRNEIAFHPYGKQRVLFFKKEIFSLLRISPDGKENIIILLNITNKFQSLHLERNDVLSKEKRYIDIISGLIVKIEEIILEPYQVIWLKCVQ